MLERLPEHIARLEADAARYADAAPFPHIVIDDFLDAGTLAQAMAEFPAPEQITDWRRADASAAQGRVAQVTSSATATSLRSDRRCEGWCMRSIRGRSCVTWND